MISQSGQVVSERRLCESGDLIFRRLLEFALGEAQRGPENTQQDETKNKRKRSADEDRALSLVEFIQALIRLRMVCVSSRIHQVYYGAVQWINFRVVNRFRVATISYINRTEQLVDGEKIALLKCTYLLHKGTIICSTVV